METNIIKIKTLQKFLFKSYYVVWKRNNETEQLRAVGGFKSYYVVWKPFFAWLLPAA